jgi:hypothetical protein
LAETQLRAKDAMLQRLDQMWRQDCLTWAEQLDTLQTVLALRLQTARGSPALDAVRAAFLQSLLPAPGRRTDVMGAATRALAGVFGAYREGLRDGSV